MPAPFMSPPRLIGNTGEYGEFVLPLNVPGKAGRGDLKTDDFTFKAASWTLTAHEARPGHELQFAAMIENGVSTARAVFAFTSVNVEGRSEERRGGKECVSTGRYRGMPYH